MNIFTQAKVSPVGKVNIVDIQNIVRSTAIFFAAPILIYLAQLTGTLTQSHIILGNEFLPNTMTVGAIEGWAVGIAINFFLKLRDGSK